MDGINASHMSVCIFSFSVFLVCCCLCFMGERPHFQEGWFLYTDWPLQTRRRPNARKSLYIETTSCRQASVCQRFIVRIVAGIRCVWLNPNAQSSDVVFGFVCVWPFEFMHISLREIIVKRDFFLYTYATCVVNFAICYCSTDTMTANTHTHTSKHVDLFQCESTN